MRFPSLLLFALLILVLICVPVQAQKYYGHGNGYYNHSYTHYSGYYPYYAPSYYTPSYCAPAAPAAVSTPIASDTDKALKELLLRKLIAEQTRADVPVQAITQPPPQYASKPGDQLTAEEITMLKELIRKASGDKVAADKKE